jgi:Fe2+ or Zn2+ uptake regulation protein
VTRGKTRETFVCAACGGIFTVPDKWGEAEARAELAQRFPGATVEQCEEVCENCDAAIEAWIKAGCPRRRVQ